MNGGVLSRPVIMIVVGIIIAILGGAFLPGPFGTVAYVLGGILALVGIIYLVIALL